MKTWDSNAWSTFFNFFVAVGTIGAVITSLFLYQRAAKDNFENMAKSQRAYMLVDTVKIISHKDHNKFEFKLIFKNAGLSLATNIRINVNCGSLDYPVSSDFIFEDVEGYKEGSIFHCAPSNTIETCLIYSNEEMNSIAMSELKENKKFFIWGWTEYNDVFTKKRHRTEFCYFHETLTEKIKSSAIQIFGHRTASHSFYNNIDDRCIHKTITS